MRSPRNLGFPLRLFQKSADGEALPRLAVLTFLVTVIVRCCARCTQVPSTTSRASSFILVGCWTSFSVLAAQRAGPRCHTISARSSTGGAAAAAARTWVRPGSCRVSGRGTRCSSTPPNLVPFGATPSVGPCHPGRVRFHGSCVRLCLRGSPLY